MSKLDEAIAAGFTAETLEEIDRALGLLAPFMEDPDRYPEAWGASEQAAMMKSALQSPRDEWDAAALQDARKPAASETGRPASAVEILRG